MVTMKVGVSGLDFWGTCVFLGFLLTVIFWITEQTKKLGETIVPRNISQANIKKEFIPTCSINQLTFGGCCSYNSKTCVVPLNLRLHYTIVEYRYMRAWSLLDCVTFVTSLK